MCDDAHRLLGAGEGLFEHVGEGNSGVLDRPPPVIAPGPHLVRVIEEGAEVRIIAPDRLVRDHVGALNAEPLYATGGKPEQIDPDPGCTDLQVTAGDTRQDEDDWSRSISMHAKRWPAPR